MRLLSSDQRIHFEPAGRLTAQSDAVLAGERRLQADADKVVSADNRHCHGGMAQV
jgi:hypothetical protein